MSDEEKRAPREVPAILRPLPPEELAKVEPLTEEEVLEALRQGAEDRRRVEELIGACVIPNIPFRSSAT